MVSLLLAWGAVPQAKSVTCYVTVDTAIGDVRYDANTDYRNSSSSFYPYVDNTTGTTSDSLFYFDLSAYAGQTVTGDGTVHFFWADEWGGTKVQFDLYKATTSWANLPDGEATYNHLLAIGYRGSSPIASYSTTCAGDGSVPTHDLIFTIPQSVLQGWLDDPSTNYGLIVNAAPQVSGVVDQFVGCIPMKETHPNYTYITLSVLEAPTFVPGGRYISGPTDITITSSITGASIYYTTDGTTPSANHGTLYNGPVSVSAGTTLKAVSVVNGYSSKVKSETYVLITNQINYNAYDGFSLAVISSGKCGVVGIEGDSWNNMIVGTSGPMTLCDSTGKATKLTVTSTLSNLGWHLEIDQGYPSIPKPYTILRAYHYTTSSGTVTLAGFTGASATASYDLYIYEANNWTSSQTTRYSVNGGSVYPCLNSPFNVTSFVEGQNYVIIRDITPVNGQIVLTVSGVEGNGILNGFQLVTGSDPDLSYYNRPETISAGSVTVNGDLGDWSGATWAPLDTTYDISDSSEETLNADIAEAYYAAKWQENKLYVAVKVKDMSHYFADYNTGWDKRDAMELYLHTDGGDPTNYANATSAQQYVIGIKDSDHTKAWACIGGAGTTTAIPEDGSFDGIGKVAVRVDDDWLYYEVEVTPFTYFSYIAEGNLTNSVMTNLSAGNVIGLDVCVDGHNATAYTGMKAENSVISKWSDWNLFGQHKLVCISGDANLDGAVDVGDLGILAANYGGTGKTWAQGDFNDDGAVDVGDLGILAANYGTGSASGADFNADYAKVFGTAATSVTAEDSTDDSNSTFCSSLGLSLIAGLALMGLMIVKLEE
jgi:hypothetical protein